MLKYLSQMMIYTRVTWLKIKINPTIFLFILLLLLLQRNEASQSNREEETARSTVPPTPILSKPSGLLSQALIAAEKAVAPKPDTMQNTNTERPRDLGSLRPNAKTSSVVLMPLGKVVAQAA